MAKIDLTSVEMAEKINAKIQVMSARNESLVIGLMIVLVLLLATFFGFGYAASTGIGGTLYLGGLIALVLMMWFFIVFATMAYREGNQLEESIKHEKRILAELLNINHHIGQSIQSSEEYSELEKKVIQLRLSNISYS